jgi:hypothetical protein
MTDVPRLPEIGTSFLEAAQSGSVEMLDSRGFLLPSEQPHQHSLCGIRNLEQEHHAPSRRSSAKVLSRVGSTRVGIDLATVRVETAALSGGQSCA